MTINDKKPLFSFGTDWKYNACRSHDDEWEIYASGYSNAADLLITHSAESNQMDSLAFPIIFLFRQSLELQLKRTIGLAKQFLDVQNQCKHTHNLLLLWKEAEPLIRKSFRLESKKLEEVFDLEQVKHVLLEFEKHDNTSTAFRYPINTKGKESLSKKITHINLRDFQKQIEPVSYMFSCLICGLGGMLSWKQDQESC